MSNDSKASSKRRKYSIESVQITPEDNATVKSVMARLMGRSQTAVPAAETSVDESTTEISGTTRNLGTTDKTGTTNQSSSTNISTTTEKSGTATETGTTKLISTTKRAGTTSKSAVTRLRKPVVEQQGVAPARDFQRVPNSVTREAMAARLFRGKSKQVWDYLWSVSRGAIVPVRTVRKSRPQIKVGAGLGSMGTVDAALDHLQTVGLIAVKTIVGENRGNEYEIFTPEEATVSLFGAANLTGTTGKSGTTESTQNSVVPVVPEFGSTGTTPSANTSMSSESPKTFLKDNRANDDDDAARRLVSKLRVAERDLTGKESQNPEQWEALAELLVTELRIAAARTTVSSVPAFLTEHLRRRLWKKENPQLIQQALPGDAREGKPAVDASKCPDCGGSGLYYPEGYDKGVAKCRHEKLGS